MKSNIDKKDENNVNLLVNSVSAIQGNDSSKFSFEGDCPATIYQKKHQEMMDNSPRAFQLRTLQQKICCPSHDQLSAEFQQNAVTVAKSPTAKSNYGLNQPIQMIDEKKFKADPRVFMEKNTITPDFQVGVSLYVKQKYGDIPGVKNLLVQLIANLESIDRQWFRLILDETFSTEERNVYHLAPAIDKLLENPGNNEILNELNSIFTKLKVDLNLDSDDDYISASYIPYFSGTNPSNDNVGKLEDIKFEAPEDLWSPDFIFTAAMNGCALAITNVTHDSFTAWHYQSPSSYMEQVVDFMATKGPTDWFSYSEYGPEETKKTFAATNILTRGRQGWEILSQLNEDASGSYANITNINEQRLLNSPPQMLYRDMFIPFPTDIHNELQREYPKFIKRYPSGNRDFLTIGKFFTQYDIHLEHAIRALGNIITPADLIQLSTQLSTERLQLNVLLTEILRIKDEYLMMTSHFEDGAIKEAEKKLKVDFDKNNFEHRSVLNEILRGPTYSRGLEFGKIAFELNILLRLYDKHIWIDSMAALGNAMDVQH